MLRIVAHEDLGVLAGCLGDALSVAPSDPMVPDRVVVPSPGVGRWLRLDLARRLGSSGHGATDGVAANIEMIYTTSFVDKVLSPRSPADDDPWSTRRLGWLVLEMLIAHGHEDVLSSVSALPQGATLWGRARRIARVMRRYLVQRPSMLRSWEQGHDVDLWGEDLPDRVRWQPAVWRYLCERIVGNSPTQVIPERISTLRDGGVLEGALGDVPQRMQIFGLTSLPDGETFIELLAALGVHAEVNVFLHQPSRVLVGAVADADVGHLSMPLRRSDDPTRELASHPLLRSWATPAREALVVLGAAGHPIEVAVGRDLPSSQSTLLGSLQRDIGADRAPKGDHELGTEDRSVRIHSCHGPSRQVEVLRDELLHLLAADPSLTEDDIVVMCPSLDQYVPLIESLWGPSVADGEAGIAKGTPELAYRITDRAIGSLIPLLGALGTVVELVDSRFSDAAVMEVVDLGPVRERYGFDDAQVARIRSWIDAANTRWGIDGAHRSRWGLPDDYEDVTWTAALDRLLIGVTTSVVPDSLAAGDLLPIDVEGDGIALLGRFCDLMTRLIVLADHACSARDVRGWVALLRQAGVDLFATTDDTSWQYERLNALFEKILDEADTGAGPSAVELDFSEMKSLLGDHLGRGVGRAAYFRGGVTVTSMSSLSSVPYRVVCILGFDESALATGAPSGDDLAAMHPVVGDHDDRDELRQSLLGAVLAARSHLVITRTGHSVVTNQVVPAAVALSELRDVIAATLHPVQREASMKSIEVIHPRQAYDERNFISRELDGSLRVPWSFDHVARDAALERRVRVEPEPFLRTPIHHETPSIIELSDLKSFFKNPTRYFLRRILGVELPELPDRSRGTVVSPVSGSSGLARPADGSDLVVDLEGLDVWNLYSRLIRHLRHGFDVDSFVAREHAAQLLPPGVLFEAVMERALKECRPIVGHLESIGVGRLEPSVHLVDVALPTGVRLVGSVVDECGDEPGPVEVSPSRFKDSMKVPAWLDLVTLTVQRPDVAWRSRLLCRPTKDTAKGYYEVVLAPVGDDRDDRYGRAVAALSTVVDLFIRGQREPIPLFPELCHRLAGGGAQASGSWNGYQSRGDGDDRWVQLAFGDISYEELLAIPCEQRDPEGDELSRVGRFSEVFVGAMEPWIKTGKGAEARVKTGAKTGRSGRGVR